MTAEIAIMNKEAVALAADSAVTISQGGAPKIFASANKLFALSLHHPIGIMVYENASFMGIPWETVIKLYRARLGNTAYPTVNDYADDFIGFLQNESSLAPVESQEVYVARFLASHFARVAKQIEDKVDIEIQDEPIRTYEEFGRLYREVKEDVLASNYQRWRRADYAVDMDSATAIALRKRYRAVIREKKGKYFGSDLTPRTSRMVTLLAGCVLSKYDEQALLLESSGVVIAGFGEEQLFPSLSALIVSGISDDRLKYRQFEGKSADIGIQNGSAIIPFAQEEMVQSFMVGIDPEFRGVLLGAVNGMLKDYPTTIIDNVKGITEQERKRLRDDTAKASQRIFEEFLGKLNDIGRTTFIAPVINTVASMPKSELPAVAEALVNLQSFKRRVSQEQETVGGPIDVMLISKGDGLVWIKRKHYFERDLNPHYFQSVSKEVRSGKRAGEQRDIRAQNGRERGQRDTLHGEGAKRNKS